MESKDRSVPRRERSRAPRLDERTVEDSIEQMNNPPPPEPTQAEADALLSGETQEVREAREKHERDVKPAEQAGYKTR